MTLSPEILERCLEVRRDLHRTPELSGRESATANRIRDELARLQPDRLATGVGGHGILASFEGEGRGPEVLLRCELDALPIDEAQDAPHASRVPGVSHKCGHDGHMATMLAVASDLARRRPGTGRVTVLFQPAEETGQGAARMLAEPVLRESPPDFVLAFHNLPGFPLGTVVLRDDLFALGSLGADLRFQGQESHAAEPELGVSPVAAIAEVATRLPTLAAPGPETPAGGAVTITHLRVGEPAFGMSPAFGRLLATFRCETREGLSRFRAATAALATQTAGRHRLKHELTWHEEFPPTRCDPTVVSLVETCGRDLGLPVLRAADPFRWSEDFGHFTSAVPGALFGLGAGVDHPSLHHPDYDFPDALIEIGGNVLLRVVRGITSPPT